MKYLKKVAYYIYLIIVCLGVSEVMYRWQLLDFYKAELNTLNSPNIKSSKPYLCVYGDSFSASSKSYVQILRDSLKSFQVINHAIPGTGIEEANAIIASRQQIFPSSIMVYQIYVGNDLVNIRKQTAWEHLSFFKNCYYTISNHLKFVEWLNYKLSQKAFFARFKKQIGVDNSRYNDDFFSPQFFSPYEKQLLVSEQNLIENSVIPLGKRAEDVQKLIDELDYFVKVSLKTAQKLYILVYPHCSQVNDFYQDKYRQMGFKITSNARFMEEEFPLIIQIRHHFKSNSSVEIVNPLKAIRENDTPQNRTYLANDFHASAWGQEIVGIELVKKILTKKSL